VLEELFNMQMEEALCL